MRPWPAITIFLLSLATLALGPSSRAADPKLEIKHGLVGHPDEIWVTDSSTNPPHHLKIGTTRVIPAGTRLYAWGPEEKMQDWAAKGFPDTEELKAERTRQQGYYVSADVASSAQYGRVLVVWETKRDLRLSKLHYPLPAEVAGKLPERPEIEKALGLDGHEDSTAYEWLAVNDPTDCFESPHLGTAADLAQSKKFQTQGFSLRDFLKTENSFPVLSIPGVERLYPEVAKLLKGVPLTEAEEQTIREQVPYLGGTLQFLGERKLFHGRLALAITRKFPEALKSLLVGCLVDGFRAASE